MAQSDSTRLQKFKSRAGLQFYDTQELKPTLMPAIDIDALLNKEQTDTSGKISIKFGEKIQVLLNMRNSGEWINLKNGAKVWVLKIKSDDAVSINLLFNQFQIPEGAEVYIYNDSETDIQGPLNHMFNKNGGSYANAPIQGEAIIIEYYQPADLKETGNIEVGTVVHGFKSLESLSTTLNGNFGGSGPCNRDIKCESSWSLEANAVALIFEVDSYIGTGALINNTNQNGHPYFLTATHITNLDMDDFVFVFKYWSSACGGGNGSTNTFVSGADNITFFQDIALIELQENPKLTWWTDDWTHLGWSVINSIPNAAASIHHPEGDVMKIAFGNQITRGLNGDGEDVWKVDLYDGVALGTSSGGPFFNINTKRLIGNNNGASSGSISCSNPNFLVYYNRLESAWPTLCPYLDPNNTGAVSLGSYGIQNGTLFWGTTTIPTITQSGTIDVCTTNKPFTLNNAPYGTTWTVTPASLVSVASGSGGTAIIRAKTSTSSGAAQLKFTFGCKTYTKNIQIGKINSGQIAVSGTTGVCPGNQYTYTASPSGTSYSWTYPSGWTKISQSGNQIALYVPSYNPQYGTVRVSITNNCGTSPFSGVTVFPGYSCGGYLTAGEFVIYPNPADEHLVIEQSEILTDLIQEDSTASQSLELKLNTTQKTESFSARLYDSKQFLVAEGVSQDTKIQLDTSKLPSGTYYLNIYFKEAVLQKQVVIE
jgi:hypothetical protein